ncbi:hypothetical protein AB0C86_36780 [Streptomyces lavendulae]|uniref:hypothetical protein n=1 Tax=Streptomyces lavendulae TaxID=1914 RepID=UPI0034073051
MFKRHVSALMVATGCLLLSACSGTTQSAAAGHAPGATRSPVAPSAPQTGKASSSSVALPKPGAAGAIPDTARLRELVLQPGEAAGVPNGESGIREVNPGELTPLPQTPPPAPCKAMWAEFEQRGAQAAIAQTFDSNGPADPRVNSLASYAATGAETAFAQLRAAVAACPSDSANGNKVTVAYEDLDKAGFPEDTIRIRITSIEDNPADNYVVDKIVTRVGVCIVDTSGMGKEPHPRLAEEPVLRQIERLRAGQGL